MKLLIVAATPFEILPLEQHLKNAFVPHGQSQFQYGRLNVTLLVTGVGLTATAFAMGQILAAQRYDLIINAGICGAYDRSLALGDVVQVVSEVFGDMGAEESDGSFTDAFGIGLLGLDQPPFKNGLLLNEGGSAYDFLPKVAGVSVNKVHGSQASITALQQRLGAQVESMEGAAFFYACLMTQAPFLQIRAISNYVEPRNKDNWNIPLAIDRLNEVLAQMVNGLAV
ncbi:MAG: futalosine hydrolase [Saprospiraceae bacterium]|jgi:futalosine hydrolase|nr:futalosine hydrolase [Saprospiraceae bacterium]HRD80245.1 futalosine hydrolase [Saprospiraceae bacterium]